MKNIILLLFVLSGLAAVKPLYSQNAEADKLYRQAMAKMDNEKDFTTAIQLLDQAIKLDVKNLDYQYGKAYACFNKDDFNATAKILEKLVKASAAIPVYYQLLGDTYVHLNDKGRSDAIYLKGIEKFPDAGLLYAGQGIKEYNNKNNDKAIEWFEKGIEFDPLCPTNYYYASLLYGETTERVWSILYGEIFCNMETQGSRFDTVSKSLYDVYNRSITFKDSSIAVSFTQFATIPFSDLSNFKLPFANGVFEMNYLLSLVGEKEMNIAVLNNVRTNFISLYFSNKQNITYSNILFEYHKKLIDANYFECYNYRLFRNGNTTEADKWIEQNKEKYAQFSEWFFGHPLVLTKYKRFYRYQY
jgi:tetratricopeptide (TPR) repeat protein